METRERCGRKRATTVEQDEAIVRLATQTPITAARAVLPALGLTCSVDTVRERLHKAGIHNWSPSRKYMQRIPLGLVIYSLSWKKVSFNVSSALLYICCFNSEADGAAIQQAVWRPTGTQLGKKKAKDSNTKTEKNGAAAKKKNYSKKVKFRETYVDDGAPSESQKQSQSMEQQQQEFVFPQQNLPLAPSASQTTEIQEFGNALSLVQQSQPIYQHSELNIVQNWPLDLVQGSHHYPQVVFHLFMKYL